MHDLLFPISVLCLVILLLIFLLKRFHQPYLIAYILAGVLLGRHSLQILSDGDDIDTVGSLGVLLLMFFLGMEIDIPDRKSLLLKPILAQAIKTALSILLAFIIGYFFHLNRAAIVLLIVLLAFNSTAVVSEGLRQNGAIQEDMAKTLLNMLLLQDILLAPVLTLLQTSGQQAIEIPRLLLSLAACVLIFLLLRSIRQRNVYPLPFLREMEQDHDLQVFAGACLCLGFALLASLAGLSGPVGAFTAGLYIGRARSFHWLESTLMPFKVFFTALFFVALGLMVNVPFIITHGRYIICITVVILVVNSLLSAMVFRVMGHPWKTSLPAGALLSQTGEFSLIACTLAYKAGVIDGDLFKGAVGVIVLTLLLSTPWAAVFRQFFDRQTHPINHKKANLCQ